MLVKTCPQRTSTDGGSEYQEQDTHVQVSNQRQLLGCRWTRDSTKTLDVLSVKRDQHQGIKQKVYLPAGPPCLVCCF